MNPKISLHFFSLSTTVKYEKLTCRQVILTIEEIKTLICHTTFGNLLRQVVTSSLSKYSTELNHQGRWLWRLKISVVRFPLRWNPGDLQKISGLAAPPLLSMLLPFLTLPPSSSASSTPLPHPHLLSRNKDHPFQSVSFLQQQSAHLI